MEITPGSTFQLGKTSFSPVHSGIAKFCQKMSFWSQILFTDCEFRIYIIEYLVFLVSSKYENLDATTYHADE